MNRADYEECQQQFADDIDEDIISDPDVPAGVRARVRRDLAARRALMGGREYRATSQPWYPRSRQLADPDLELRRRRLRLLELQVT